MRVAPIPENEGARIAALWRYGVLDTPAEGAFDELTALAAELCGTPVAFIGFMDERRQWLKSRKGLDFTEVPRDLAFCAHAILGQQPLIVGNVNRDDRFRDNPLLHRQLGIQFYGATPLISADGYALGTLVILDRKPRRLRSEQIHRLDLVARQVMAHLELRRHLADLARSIDEHKRTESRLRDSELFYQTLVETLPQNILRKDVQGRFTFANRKFCQSIGKPLDEILGKTDFDFFPRQLATKYLDDDLRVMATRENLDTVEEHVTPGGEKLFVHVIKTPLFDSRGRVAGIQGIFWDVTQRKRIEHELEHTRDAALESARVKSAFLANMSHEIRTPMNAIVGMAGLLLDTRLTQEQREFAETIRGSTESLMTIVNDILDYSKIEAGKLKLESVDFDLRDTVETTMEMLGEVARQKEIEIGCWIEPDVPVFLRGDPGRVRQVLANLLSNAVKFTEHGAVLVRVARVSETDQDALVHFSVIDTGVGFDPRGLPEMFAPFTQGDTTTTRRYGGTGLGLSICKQLVDLMGGRISCETTVGQGSTFWFELRLRKQPGKPLPPQWEPLHGLRVLIISDNETNRQVLKQQLGPAELQQLVTTTSALAHDTLSRAAQARIPFQIAILSSDDPTMEGLALARSIQNSALAASTRLIVITPLGRRLNTATMQQAGIAACLVKPVRQSRLLETMVDVLNTAAGVLKAKDSEALVHDSINTKYVRVLVAEDNVVNQRVIVRQLNKLGFSAHAVANGKEVLETLRAAPYDVVLLDCQMPEVDGYEVARQLRAHGLHAFKSEPYLIALTANALPGDRERCLNAGMNDYLTKPVQLESLEGVLQRALLKVRPALQAREQQAQDSPVDLGILHGLRELAEPGKPEPLHELIELFVRDAQPKLDKMKLALERKDFASLSSAAHSLKGSASNLGAKRLAEMCASLEKLAKASDFAEAADLLLEIRREFHRVESALVVEMQK